MIHCWHVTSRKYILLPQYVCTAQGKNQSFSSQTCKNDFNSISICSHFYFFPKHCARYHLWPPGPTQPHVCRHLSPAASFPQECDWQLQHVPGVIGAEGQWLITDQLHALLRGCKSMTQNHLAQDISWLLRNSFPSLPCVSFFILDFYQDLNTYLRVLSGCTGFQRQGSLPSFLPSPVWFTCSRNWYSGPIASTDHHLMLHNHVTVALHLHK